MIKRTLIFLDRFHWLWLLLAAPFLFFPSPARSPVMLVIPGLFLLHWLAIKGKKQAVPQEEKGVFFNRPSAILRTPLNGALLLLLLMVLISLWVTFDITYSLPKISGVILGIGIFFAFAREGQTPRGWWLGYLLLLGIGFAIAVAGLLGTHWVAKISILAPIISRLSPRITGLPGAEEGFNQNGVAGVLLWVIPCFLAVSWLLLCRAKALRGLIGHGKSTTIIVLTIGATLWTIAILLLTQSRDGYLSLALTLPLLTLIALPPKWRKYSLAILMLIAIALGILLASKWSAVSAWVMGSDLAADPVLSLNSLAGRLEIWSRAIYGIQDFPFTGMGMNTFRKVMPVLYPLFTYLPEIDIGHAHNEFLQAALDLGIPGLIAFIALYIIAFWMLIRIWQSARLDVAPASNDQHKEDPLSKKNKWFSKIDSSPFADANLVRIAVLGLGGGLLAHMLWGLTDALSLGGRPAFLLWVILGLINGLHTQAQEHGVPVDSGVSTTVTENE